jgi:hypothetical protein
MSIKSVTILVAILMAIGCRVSHQGSPDQISGLTVSGPSSDGTYTVVASQTGLVATLGTRNTYPLGPNHIGIGRLRLLGITLQGLPLINCQGASCGTLYEVDDTWLGGVFGNESDPVISVRRFSDGIELVSLTTVSVQDPVTGTWTDIADTEITHEITPDGYSVDVLTHWLADTIITDSIRSGIHFPIDDSALSIDGFLTESPESPGSPSATGDSGWVTSRCIPGQLAQGTDGSRVILTGASGQRLVSIDLVAEPVPWAISVDEQDGRCVLEMGLPGHTQTPVSDGDISLESIAVTIL